MSEILVWGVHIRLEWLEACTHVWGDRLRLGDDLHLTVGQASKHIILNTEKASHVDEEHTGHQRTVWVLINKDGFDWEHIGVFTANLGGQVLNHSLWNSCL